jgi:hypothetical protein
LPLLLWLPPRHTGRTNTPGPTSLSRPCGLEQAVTIAQISQDKYRGQKPDGGGQALSLCAGIAERQHPD